MPYADIPGVRIWFTDTGGVGAASDNRTPVVFLHAASGTTDSWVYQEPAFLAAGFRCIAYDRRDWAASGLIRWRLPSSISSQRAAPSGLIAR